jgi:hypothetical protein
MVVVALHRATQSLPGGSGYISCCTSATWRARVTPLATGHVCGRMCQRERALPAWAGWLLAPARSTCLRLGAAKPTFEPRPARVRATAFQMKRGDRATSINSGAGESAACALGCDCPRSALRSSRAAPATFRRVDTLIDELSHFRNAAQVSACRAEPRWIRLRPPSQAIRLC